jgi:hypothetical protein
MDGTENDITRFSINGSVFVAALIFLSSRCLATIRRQTHRLLEGIYEARRRDGLSRHEIHTRFH